MQDGFESGDLSHSQNGFVWGSPNKTYVNSLHAKSGKFALEFRYPAAPDGKDSWSEQRFRIGAKYRELWIKYDLFVPSNYYHRTQSSSANNKGFVHVWEDNYSPTPGLGLGPNFWPASNGESTATLYNWADNNRIQKHWNNFTDRVIKTTDRGKWMEVIVHYKYASASNNDGVAQIWLKSDGQPRRQVLNITDGPWYVAAGKGFNEGYLLGWANSGFAEETRFYIDDIVFATDPGSVGMGVAPSAVKLTVE